MNSRETHEQICSINAVLEDLYRVWLKLHRQVSLTVAEGKAMESLMTARNYLIEAHGELCRQEKLLRGGK